MSKRVGYLLYCVLIVIPLLEGLLWLTGYRPYQYQNFSIQSLPSRSIVPHDSLGFALNRGSFTVTINEGLTYQATHTSPITRILSLDSVEMDKPLLAIFGCSYTYGMGVDDSEAFAAQLMQLENRFRISSFAVPGYGTVQGFMNLKKMVESGVKPHIALFNFADFHMDRNSMTPAYRLHLSIGYKLAMHNDDVSMSASAFPYVSLINDSLVYTTAPWSELYENWPGRETFALINLLQTISDKYETASIDSKSNSILLYEEISNFCKLHDIRLIVAGITDSVNTHQMLDSLAARTIEVVDISLPLENEAYNNLPFDSHPNVLAHRLMAEKMKSHLSQENNLIKQ